MWTDCCLPFIKNTVLLENAICFFWPLQDFSIYCSRNGPKRSMPTMTLPEHFMSCGRKSAFLCCFMMCFQHECIWVEDIQYIFFFFFLKCQALSGSNLIWKLIILLKKETDYSIEKPCTLWQELLLFFLFLFCWFISWLLINYLLLLKDAVICVRNPSRLSLFLIPLLFFFCLLCLQLSSRSLGRRQVVVWLEGWWQRKFGRA